MACTPWETGQNGQVAVRKGGAQEPLLLGRPTCGVGRPPVGPPDSQLLPDASSMVLNFENVVHDQSLLERDVQVYSPKDFKTQKIFLVYNFLKRKVLEKIPAYRKNIFFSKFKHTMEKQKR